MKPVKTIACEHGVTIKVYQDIDAQSPADYENTYAFLWADDRDLCVGPRTKSPKPVVPGKLLPLSSLASLPEDFDPEYDTPPYAIFSVSVYNGSNGSSVALRSGADISHQFADDYANVWNGKAFVFIKRADFPSDADWIAIAKSVIEGWNTYLSGDVYGYVIEDAEGEQLASLWGFYGIDCCIEEAKAAAETEMPIARGRALIRKLADDMQRYMVRCQDNIDRSGTNLPRRDYYWAGNVTANLALDKQADMMAAMPRNFDVNNHCSVKWYDLRSYSGYGEDVNNHYNGNPLLACLVHEEWKKRYWPGD